MMSYNQQTGMVPLATTFFASAFLPVFLQKLPPCRANVAYERLVTIYVLKYGGVPSLVLCIRR